MFKPNKHSAVWLEHNRPIIDINFSGHYKLNEIVKIKAKNKWLAQIYGKIKNYYVLIDKDDGIYSLVGELGFTKYYQYYQEKNYV